MSCRVGPGEIVALVGRSGSGKSTLLRALVRLVTLPGTFVGLILGGAAVDVAELVQRAVILPGERIGTIRSER